MFQVKLSTSTTKANPPRGGDAKLRASSKRRRQPGYRKETKMPSKTIIGAPPRATQAVDNVFPGITTNETAK
jgi:hypothetical protein